MKYTALEFEIIKATSEDIITTSSLHTGIHRFDKYTAEETPGSSKSNVSDENFDL